MGCKQDIEELLKDYHVTCIDGQLTDKDLTKFKSKLLTMAASISTTNREGLHCNVGMICEDADYTHCSCAIQNPSPFQPTQDPIQPLWILLM
jgi:hypothetical protein